MLSDPPGWVIRVGDVTDAPGIASMHVASWRAAYRGLLPDDLLDSLSVARRTERWHDDLAGSVADIVVAATSDGEVVGVVRTGPSRDPDAPDGTGEVMAIYLHPRVWSLGVGARLHAAGLASLRARFDRATLWVLDGNLRARAFYERQGWVPDGAVKEVTMGGADVVEVRYGRALPG